jgi:para-nitrobenzyl esterase
MTVSANTPSKNEIADRADIAYVEVETSYGRLRGQEIKGIKVWRGIPYGASTAGKNRFLPPRKPAAWTGVRDALQFGHSAPQPTDVTSEYGKLIGWDKQPAAFSEDCLALNVWTPGVGDGGKRTVMVSLHGGGFTSGSGSSAGYDGASLARFGDVVVVTINHRLGALGYLHLADLGAPAEFAQSGAAGMLDISLALEWVRDNAERFGGDPNSVMVWGQSGGGAKTSTLLAMPSAQGLFKRAAIQSGSVLRLTPRDLASQLAERLLAKLGLDKSKLAELQALPFERLVAAQSALSPDMPMLGFAPVVDGTAIPHHPFEPTAPAISADIPIIVGTTLDDAAMTGRADITDADIKARLQKRHGANTDRIVETYRKRWPDASSFLLQARMNTDRGGRRAANTMAERKAAQGRAAAYLYQFDFPSPAAGGKYGAVHGIDVSLAFNNGRGALAGDTEESRALAARFAAAWVAFAKTGDPNTPAMPRWEPFNAQTRPTMVFDHEISLQNDPLRELRTLWDDLRTPR